MFYGDAEVGLPDIDINDSPGKALGRRGPSSWCLGICLLRDRTPLCAHIHKYGYLPLYQKLRLTCEHLLPYMWTKKGSVSSKNLSFCIMSFSLSFDLTLALMSVSIRLWEYSKITVHHNLIEKRGNLSSLICHLLHNYSWISSCTTQNTL